MSRVRTRLKRGDKVRIIAGKEKGSEGEIIAIYPEKSRVVVRDANVVKKAKRPSQDDPSGGYEEVEAAIHISNVQLLDPNNNQLSRVGYKIDDEGNKVRFSRKSGKALD